MATSMTLDQKDLCLPPGSLDQTLLFETINYNTNSSGQLEYTPVTANVGGYIQRGTILVDYRGMVNIAQIQVQPFYIPKYPSWNLQQLEYMGRIFLGIGEVNNNGYYGYQPSFNGQLLTYQYQFSFAITDIGDRYELTPIVGTFNFKNLIQFNQSITLIFYTPLGEIKMPNPYGNFTVTYGTFPTVFSIPTTSPPHNYVNENQIEVLTSTVQGITPLTPYIITVLTPWSFSIDVDTTAYTGTQSVTVLNLAWLVSIPMRVRQVEKLNVSSNRILPVST
jgi:hypothetical protein